MQKQINSVKEFHKAFKINSEIPIATLGDSKNTLRYHLMKEENEEYLEAVQNDNLIEIADALGDMMYILCGTIIEHGLQHKIEAVFDEKFNEVSKLDHSGNPISGRRKVMKGPNYFKPDFLKYWANNKVCIRKIT
jgi:predicted HAD superfamily Cof-like phosphohydrolase